MPSSSWEEDGAGAQFLLDLRVIREIDGDHLEAGVGVAAAVEHVAGEDVGLAAGDEGAVRRVAGEHFLEFRKTGREGVQLLGALQVLQEHVGAVGGLGAIEGVIHGLVRADHEVHLAVGHLQPGLVARVVVVRPEAFDLLEEVLPDAGLDGDVGGRLQIVGDLVDGFGVGVVVPDSLQGAVPGTLDEGVRAVLGGIGQRVELRGGHIGRIEAGAGRLGGIALHERLSVDAVPGAVVDLGIKLGGGIGQGSEERVLLPEILFPIDLVHLVRGEAVQVQHLLAIVGDAREVRSGDLHHGVILHQAVRLGPVRFTGDGHEGKERHGGCKFSHIVGS